MTLDDANLSDPHLPSGVPLIRRIKAILDDPTLDDRARTLRINDLLDSYTAGLEREWHSRIEPMLSSFETFDRSYTERYRELFVHEPELGRTPSGYDSSGDFAEVEEFDADEHARWEEMSTSVDTEINRYLSARAALGGALKSLTHENSDLLRHRPAVHIKASTFKHVRHLTELHGVPARDDAAFLKEIEQAEFAAKVHAIDAESRASSSRSGEGSERRTTNPMVPSAIMTTNTYVPTMRARREQAERNFSNR